MKPHLRIRRGIWVCSRMVGLVGLPPLGHGYTAAEAFKDWESQCSDA